MLKRISATAAVCLFLACFSPVVLAGSGPSQVPAYIWKKGPLMDQSSPYSRQKAPALFLCAVVSFCLLSVVMFFVIHLCGRSGARMINDWAIVCGVLVLSFLSVEAGLRWYIAANALTHFRPHPELMWTIRPGLRNFINHVDRERISTNSFGLRGEELGPNKKGEIRVLALGDSANFGHGVNDEETWEYQLQLMLRKEFPGVNIRVINGACPGYTTYEGLLFLKKQGLAFTPDILIVGFNNDPCKDFLQDKDRFAGGSWMSAARSLLYKSDFYLLFRQYAVNISRWISSIKGVNVVEGFDYNDPDYKEQDEDRFLQCRVSLKDYETNLQEFISLAGDKGIRIIFIKMPINRTAVNLRERFYDPRYPLKLTEICERRKVPLVDIDSKWLAGKNMPGLFLSGHLQHPNKEGHFKMAQEIFSEIVSREFIPLIKSRSGKDMP